MDEFVGLVAVVGAFSLPAFIVFQVLKHRRWKIEFEQNHRRIQNHVGDDNSLSMRELKNVIQDAVHDATVPLQKRIKELEAQLPPHSILSDVDAYHHESEAKSVGRVQA